MKLMDLDRKVGTRGFALSLFIGAFVSAVVSIFLAPLFENLEYTIAVVASIFALIFLTVLSVQYLFKAEAINQSATELCMGALRNQMSGGLILSDYTETIVIKNGYCSTDYTYILENTSDQRIEYYRYGLYSDQEYGDFSEYTFKKNGTLVNLTSQEVRYQAAERIFKEQYNKGPEYENDMYLHIMLDKGHSITFSILMDKCPHFNGLFKDESESTAFVSHFPTKKIKFNISLDEEMAKTYHFDPNVNLNDFCFEVRDYSGNRMIEYEKLIGDNHRPKISDDKITWVVIMPVIDYHYIIKFKLKSKSLT